LGRLWSTGWASVCGGLGGRVVQRLNLRWLYVGVYVSWLVLRVSERWGKENVEEEKEEEEEQ
jgi:hypothetical protein